MKPDVRLLVEVCLEDAVPIRAGIDLERDLDPRPVRERGHVRVGSAPLDGIRLVPLTPAVSNTVQVRPGIEVRDLQPYLAEGDGLVDGEPASDAGRVWTPGILDLVGPVERDITWTALGRAANDPGGWHARARLARERVAFDRGFQRAVDMESHAAVGADNELARRS